MGRHHHSRPDSLIQRMVGWPWVTLALVGLVLGGAIHVLSEESFAATATLTADEVRAADQASVALTAPRLIERVEAEIELEAPWQDRIELKIVHDYLSPDVHVTAIAPDPRLAALAADAAITLVVQDFAGQSAQGADAEGTDSEGTDSTAGEAGQSVLTMSQAAVIPAEPDHGPSQWWWASGGILLALAALLEWRRG